jgi:lipid-binding SYLF domain-containing protein
MFRLKTFLHAAAALLALAAIATATPSQARGRGTTGTVQIDVGKAGFIVGVQGGTGVLRFRGRSYPLSIGGIGIGATIGASRALLAGTAQNLRSPGDIVGTYSQVGAGLAVIAGGKTAQLRNERGVVLNLRGRQVGVEFSLDLSGMVISMR